MTWRDTEFTHSHLLVAGRKIRVSHRPGEYAAEIGEREFAAPTVSELEVQIALAMAEAKRSTHRAAKVPAAAAIALLLCLALATGCSARTPEGYEISIGGDSASSPAVVAPSGSAAATYDAGDATVNALVHQIVLAARRFDWRGFRQGCANAQEYAKGRERAVAPASVADKDTPAVAGVRERADEAFWQELER